MLELDPVLHPVQGGIFFIILKEVYLLSTDASEMYVLALRMGLIRFNTAFSSLFFICNGD